jgi:hypothetical protein
MSEPYDPRPPWRGMVHHLGYVSFSLGRQSGRCLLPAKSEHSCSSPQRPRVRTCSRAMWPARVALDATVRDTEWWSSSTLWEIEERMGRVLISLEVNILRSKTWAVS